MAIIILLLHLPDGDAGAIGAHGHPAQAQLADDLLPGDGLVACDINGQNGPGPDGEEDQTQGHPRQQGIPPAEPQKKIGQSLRFSSSTPHWAPWASWHQPRAYCRAVTWTSRVNRSR